MLAVAFALFGIAWLFSTPPFRAPDEPAHYLRALTIADGSLLGPREPVDQLGRLMLRDGGWEAAQERWILHDRRGLVVPAGLSPPNALCLDGQPDLEGSCTEVTYTGDYFPLPYLLPAAAMAPADSATTGLWLARAGSLILALAWLVVALALTGPGVGWGTIGVVAAITPTTLFIAAVVNPSGLELAANLAFIAALGRLRRDGARTPQWVWWALVLSSSTTILAWQLGPLFALADLAVFTALLGPGALRTLQREQRTPATIAGLGLACTVGVWLIYGELSGELHSSIAVTPLGAALRGGYEQLGPTLRGAVGVFGDLTVKLPSPMSEIWWAFVAALLIGALSVADRRERVVLITTTAGALAFPVVFYAFSYRTSGFGMQGRYALGVLALVPTVSGMVLSGRPRTAISEQLIRVSLGAAALFQLIAWGVNAHHWGTTDLRIGVIGWTPPTQWWPLLAAGAVGVFAMISAGFSSRASRRA
jgi:hypothetical protein